ncbi:MAG: AMP-binding protein, partial [bacterium]
MNISRWIERNASFAPTKSALRFEDRAYTYAALAERVERAAQVLKGQLGVGRGDRVAHVGYNSPEFLILLFACARLGAMLVPLNWRLAPPEHLYIFNDASVSALFLEQPFAHLVAPVQSALPHCRIIGLDFAPEAGTQFGELLATARGDS